MRLKHDSSIYFWLIFSAIIFVSILFRVILPFNQIFTEDGILLNTSDAYNVIRIADTYPNILTYNYFTDYPRGSAVGWVLFPTLIGFIASIFNVEPIVIGAILPPILFILTLLIVYLISFALFKNKYISLISILILSIFSGDVLHRTTLGACDTHCWEMFLLSVVMLCIIYVVKGLQDTKYRKYLLFIIAGILFIGVYWLSWVGALLVPFMIIVAFIIHTYMKYLKRGHLLHVILACLILAIIPIFFGMFPEKLRYCISMVQYLFVPNISATISEEFPLVFTAGQFELTTIWYYFGALFYLIPLGIGMLIYKYKADRDYNTLLFIVWAVLMLVMMLVKRRWDYYFAINGAIIVGFVICSLYWYVKKIKVKRVILFRLVIILFILMSLLPLVKADVKIATSGDGIMTKDWQETTQWLRQYGDDDAYYNMGMPHFSVFSWWDYGYWITQRSHLATFRDPSTCDFGDAASILVETDYNMAIEKLKSIGVRFIVIDREMLGDKLPVIIKTAGIDDYELSELFMFKLFYHDIDGISTVYVSNDMNVRVFSIGY